MTDLLAELFADLGRLAWDPFWMPITAWTLLAAIALAVIAFVPAREVFLRRDLHFALLLALPAGLVASKVLGGIPGANLLRTWWQGPALVAPVTPPEMTVSPVFEQDPAGIVSIGAPVLEPSIDPAIWIGLGTLLAALVACVALVLLLVAVVRLRRLLSGATPDGELRLANGREVRILRCDRVQVPFSCGVFRPMIVLPDGPLPDRDVIVAHEAAHHEHRDVARLWSAGLVHAAFAFHPLVHLLSSRLTWLMEAACDRATLERTGLPASRYSEVLLRAVPQSAPRELRMALPMGRSVKELRSRIAALGHATNPARRGRVVSVGSMGVFAASMILVAAAGIAATEAPALATSHVTSPVVGMEDDRGADAMLDGSIPRMQMPGSSGATGGGRITGRVTDGKTGEPVRGALVYVDELHAAVPTRVDGSFSFSGIPPGTYTIRVDHEESLFVEGVVTIEATGDFSVQVDFRTEGTPVRLDVSGDGVLSIGGVRVALDDLPTVLRAQANGDAIALVVFFKARLGRAEDMALRSAIESAVGRASRNRYALRWTYAWDALPREPVDNRQGTVRGRVTRADNGEPLPGASVMVVGTSIGSVTGPDGEYFITGVSAGLHALRASFIGFMTTVHSDVVVPEGGTVTVHFALNQQVYELEEVNVPPPPGGWPPPPPPAEQPPTAPGPETFVIVEQMPELIGGLTGLQEKLIYPEIARRAGIQGRVILQFVVDTDGQVVEPVVVRGIGAGCDEEALRVVRTARFKPGIQRGEPVRVRMSLPVTFDLGPANPARRLRLDLSGDAGITMDGRPSSIDELRGLQGIDWKETLVELRSDFSATRSWIAEVRRTLEDLGALRVAFSTAVRAGDRPPPPPPAEQPPPPPGAETFVIVEQMPDLIGGLDGLQAKMIYPEIARNAGIEGRVILQFIVEPDGSVSNPVVVRGIGGGCDEEALRVVSEAVFTPGRQRGEPVRVKMSLPITFDLDPTNERPRVTIAILADGSLVVNGEVTTLEALRARTDIDWARAIVAIRSDKDAPESAMQQLREFLRTPPQNR